MATSPTVLLAVSEAGSDDVVVAASDANDAAAADDADDAEVMEVVIVEGANKR
jgi:hypothetical protein